MSNHGSTPIVARDRKGREVQYQTRGEPLGSGAGSLVYLATRLPGLEQAAADDARLVAVKITTAPKWKGHLADEARLLDDLQSRADVVVARSGGAVFRPIRILSGPTPLTVDDNYKSELIELEYLDGPTLQQWFETTWCGGKVPEPVAIVDEVLLVARQLAEALVQIQCGRPDGALIHRDIKPANIMRTSRGLRLFDFNVAREDRLSRKTQHVGTPGYIAPEVQDSDQYDARADLYSVGLILWEIAHRRRFDQSMQTHKVGKRICLKWPSSGVESWPEHERGVLSDLLPVLICDVSDRLTSAEQLLRLVDRLETPRRVARAAVDPLARLDMIQPRRCSSRSAASSTPSRTARPRSSGRSRGATTRSSWTAGCR
ncbi:MAG: protein kinase [Myxococcales bacterium]|nr:protein kinase [Myxococcales bacterium]